MISPVHHPNPGNLFVTALPINDGDEEVDGLGGGLFVVGLDVFLLMRAFFLEDDPPLVVEVDNEEDEDEEAGALLGTFFIMPPVFFLFAVWDLLLEDPFPLMEVDEGMGENLEPLLLSRSFSAISTRVGMLWVWRWRRGLVDRRR